MPTNMPVKTMLFLFATLLVHTYLCPIYVKLLVNSHRNVNQVQLGTEGPVNVGYRLRAAKTGCLTALPMISI